MQEYIIVRESVELPYILLLHVHVNASSHPLVTTIISLPVIVNFFCYC